MSKRGWILFTSLGIIWGMPYLFIRIAVEDLSPAMVVFTRVVLAAAILMPIVIKRGQFDVIRTHWRGITLFAVIEMAIPFGALGVAEQEISSSLAGLLIAAVPLVNAIITRVMKIDTHWPAKRVAGLLIGLTGVSALVGLDIHADNWWSIAICFFAVVGYAFGPVIIDRTMSDVPSIAVLTWSLVLVAFIYSPFIAIEISNGIVMPPTDAIFSVFMLGAVCTAGAFVLLFKLVAEVGPSRTTVITFINPAVALALGVLVLNEPVTAGLVVGFPIVLLGSYLATRKPEVTS